MLIEILCSSTLCAFLICHKGLSPCQKPLDTENFLTSSQAAPATPVFQYGVCRWEHFKSSGFSGHGLSARRDLWRSFERPEGHGQVCEELGCGCGHCAPPRRGCVPLAGGCSVAGPHAHGREEGGVQYQVLKELLGGVQISCTHGATQFGIT